MRHGALSAGCLLLAAQAGAQIQFHSTETGNVFFAGEEARFAATGGGTHLHVRVRDCADHSVKEGEFPAKAITLGRLPRGYYRIETAEGEGTATATSFVVVPRPQPEKAGRTAIDAALSWLVPPQQVEEGAELLRRAGFSWVRDRIRWSEVEPQRGKFAWGKYDRSVNAQARRGLHICQIFHDCPPWARTDGKPDRLPDDLRDVYQFARAAAQHFRGRVGAWEVWNEADIPGFLPDPASEYAAFLKAAYLGFKAGDRSLPITQVSFAQPAGPFGESLRANGTAAYYDIYNYHVYDDPVNYATRAEGHQALLRRSGVPSRPIWVTEAGTLLPAVNNALSPEDQRRQAEFIPKSYVESLAHGTDRYFFFVFPHYLESGIAFGVLDADLKPTPGYAALATLTDALGAADYRGEIRFRQPGLHLHVFDNGEGETLVAWSDGPEARVPIGVSPAARRALTGAQVLDVVGASRPLDIGPGNMPRLTLSASPVYLRLPKDAITEPISPPTEPSAAANPMPQPPHYDLVGIVVRLRLPEASVDKRAEAFRLHAGQPAPLEAQIYNFGGRKFTGTLVLTAPTGWTLNRSRVTVTDLPSLGRQVETLTLTPGAGGTEPGQIQGVVQQPNGALSSPAVVDILLE
jgi:hypothetical protein